MADSTARERWGVAPLLLVDDVVASAAYYRDKLGFRYERLWAEPPAFCMVQRGGIILMLSQVAGARGMNPNAGLTPQGECWDAYVWVDDADALCEEFRAKGVVIAREPCDQVYGNRDFDILDCNGYRLCFGSDSAGGA